MNDKVTTEYDASDPDAVDAKRKKAKLFSKQLENGLRNSMNTVDGRAFMWDLLTRGQLFHAGFADPNLMVFIGGSRSVVMPIFSEMQRVCPDLYALMVSENRD